MKFKKILLPLDGSPLAERALAPAMCMAAGMSAEIVLLHVVVPLDIDLVLPEASLPHAAEEAGRYLAAVCARFATDGVNMTSAVVVDFNTATAVINYAEENEVDLIVMSSHGRSELTRWRYGSVSARLLRQATCPVLVIPGQPSNEPDTFRRILLPLDGSDMAAQALESAVALAHALSAELILLRAVALPYLAQELTTPERSIAQIEANVRAKAVAYLEQIKASLTTAHDISVKTVAIIGSAADVIIDYADEQDVDLIVMNSHGRSGILLWTYGSVTEKVLLGTDQAVMVVRRKSPAYLKENWT
ncbi:MAG: universal stress protein [Ardenticatenaceae bacterium]|nr:universal stress protein [Anaerolineales bacterium]MCB8940430.1 universal stress protein [Ardenticatenaceae bacterium]MCB8973446.1 universal stress protein [Ardenticatenaceae bacterium]